MTVVLILLCLAIAGRELYLAFERRRPAGAPEIADIRTQLAALKGTRDELERLRAEIAEGQARDAGALRETDARIRSLISQINDRMLPDVNDRLARQRDAADRLAAEVAGLRAHLVGRLDQAVAASLGADPADLVAGAVTPAGLAAPYERLAGHLGLRVELTDRDRYYLSGRSPRALERDFLGLLTVLRASEGGASGGTRAEEARALLSALRGTDGGGAQIGPFLAVRTPASLVCGVLPLADLRHPGAFRLLDDPADAALRLHDLPDNRFCDLSSWPALMRGPST
ncbi:hypothetical protein AGRA3207_004377 [Actinomadura graeca]|uniref:DNA recombination protein RmuC n=1 Tax=Actinomadura graeca TaxID=2750812 RepID=A0ABX8QZ20_9ACTN|nr:hypothetical protein [Actinomadura graeca]QXJ23244.1 hypothetical protein AGRA3207_004377 [Actinomadura graeca]